MRSSGLGPAEIAVRYGINDSHASRILTRKRWAHLKDFAERHGTPSEP